MSLRRLLNVFYAFLVEGEDANGRARIDAELKAPLVSEARSEEERRKEEHLRNVQANAAGVQALQQMMKTLRPA